MYHASTHMVSWQALELSDLPRRRGLHTGSSIVRMSRDARVPFCIQITNEPKEGISVTVEMLVCKRMFHARTMPLGVAGADSIR